MILGRFVFVLGLSFLLSLPALADNEEFELAESDMETEGQDVSIDNTQLMDSMDANEDDDMDELDTGMDEQTTEMDGLQNAKNYYVALRYRVKYRHRRVYGKTRTCALYPNTSPPSGFKRKCKPHRYVQSVYQQYLKPYLVKLYY